MAKHSWDAECSKLVKEQSQAFADMNARKGVAAIRAAEKGAPLLRNPGVRSPQGQLTQQILQRILADLRDRVTRLDALGPRPSARSERLTSAFGRSRKDPVNIVTHSEMILNHLAQNCIVRLVKMD